MIAEITERPPATPPKATTRQRITVGHSGRLGLTWRMRWLIFAHAAIFIASQMVDELVDWVAKPLGLIPAQAMVLEITLGLILFLLWSACMLAWVSGPGARRDQD
ncbi:MAG: hypothetical protein WD969_13835 [Paracoccaceae bacterium]